MLNRLAANLKLYYRVIVSSLVVGGLCRAVCGSDDLFGQCALAVVHIAYRIGDGLARNDLTIQLHRRFGGTDDATFLVGITILLRCQNVNFTKRTVGLLRPFRGNLLI